MSASEYMEASRAPQGDEEGESYDLRVYKSRELERQRLRDVRPGDAEAELLFRDRQMTREEYALQLSKHREGRSSWGGRRWDNTLEIHFIEINVHKDHLSRKPEYQYYAVSEAYAEHIEEMWADEGAYEWDKCIDEQRMNWLRSIS